MLQYNVTPLIGFNDVKFGMDRSQVRSILGDPKREFKKTKFSKTTTDDYIYFHVFYNKENMFEAVEFFDDVEIKLGGDMIFPTSVATLNAGDYAFVADEDGLISLKYSIGVYAPNGKAESILFGVKDYYL